MKADAPDRVPARAPRFLRLDAPHLALAAAVAVISFGQAWWRWTNWRNGFGDLAVIDQAAWLLAHGKDPIISGLGWNAFADHLAPVYLVFGLLYRIHATVGWVFLAEALAFAMSVLALPALLDELHVTGRAKTMFQAAFVLSPLMWNAVAFAGHPTTMAVPVIIVGLTAALRGRVSTTAVCIVALIFFRDDLGLAAAAVAVAGLMGDRERRWKPWLALAAGALVWEAIGGVLAQHAGADRLWLQRFSYLGDSPLDAVLHPWHSIPALAGQSFGHDSVFQVIFWIATVAFLPVLAPRRLLVVLAVGLPILAANDPTVQSVHFHHGAVMVPFLIWAAAAGLARWRSIVSVAFPPIALPLCSGLLLLGFGPIAAGHFDPSPVSRDDGEAALRAIERDAGLLAEPNVGARAAHREMLLIHSYPFEADCNAAPRVAGERSFAIWPSSVIDTVVVLEPRSDVEQEQLDAVVDSPCFADLGPPEHIGDLLVYRRVAP